jgi:glycosyltransferase involved in cell wall biosynthesis
MGVNEDRMKLAVWTDSPTHHQTGFLEALRSEDIDVIVRYCSPVRINRVREGWISLPLAPGEAILSPDRDLFADMRDWRQRIHIVGGYASAQLRQVIRRLCSARVQWVHWSEHPRPGLRGFLLHPFRKLYGHVINRYALGALAISQLAAAAFTHWGVKTERIAVLPYSVPRPAVNEPDSVCQEFLSGRKSFLFLGRMDENKGTDILIKAFSAITSRDRDWALMLVGDCNRTECFQKLCASLGVLQRVLFRGRIPSDTVGNVITLASVCVLPTKVKDGWGVVLTEAASLGLPLIASDRAGAAYHLIDPGVNGFRVAAGCVNSLEDAMRAYVCHPQLLTEHGLASARIYNQYSPEIVARRLTNILKSWQALPSAGDRRRSTFREK